MFASRSHARRTSVSVFALIAMLLVSLVASPARAQAAAEPAAPPAADPAAPAPPATDPAATPAPVDGAAVVATVEQVPTGIRLRKLEQKVQELKEQAWRIKARVGMLKEAVLGGGIGARAQIVHENKMGGSFKLVKVLYALDGQQIYLKTDDTGKLADQKRIEILSGPIAPGSHTLSVLVVYQGHGFGVFEYLNKYKFTSRSSHTFAVPEGKASSITVVGYEKGGATTPMEKRPQIDFKVNIVTESATPKAE